MARQTDSRITCDQLVPPGDRRPTTQEQIAARAFELWLAREFRDGSPQEDWLQAQWEARLPGSEGGIQ